MAEVGEVAEVEEVAEVGVVDDLIFVQWPPGQVSWQFWASHW